MTVYWVLFGSMTTGSSRIHGYRIHNYMREQGYGSAILLGPPSFVQMYDLPWHEPTQLLQFVQFQAGDTVVFETVRGRRARDLAAVLRERGVKIVFSECDIYPESDIVELADDVVCSSGYLAGLYAKRHHRKTRVIPDAVETVLAENQLDQRISRTDRNLRLVWIGRGAHWQTLKELRQVLDYAEFRDYRLLTISNHPLADIPWSMSTAMAALQTGDIAVVPTANDAYALAKSSNRVVQAMALGATVLAGRIPSYQEVIQHGKNGYLCDSAEEWVLALRSVRDPDVREAVVRQAWTVVQTDYTIQAIGPKWLIALGSNGTHEVRNEQTVSDKVRLPLTVRYEEFSECSRQYAKQHRYVKSLAYWWLELFFHPSAAAVWRGYKLLRQILASYLGITSARHIPAQLHRKLIRCKAKVVLLKSGK